MTVVGKGHLLIALEDSNNHVWNYFLKEKSEFKNEVVALLKDLKVKSKV